MKISAIAPDFEFRSQPGTLGDIFPSPNNANIDPKNTNSGHNNQTIANRTARDAIPTDLENPNTVSTIKKPTWPWYWSLWYIINVLKWGITRECKKQWLPFARQSRYHDHIVRTQQSYENIKYYIQTNPDKRSEDIHYTDT